MKETENPAKAITYRPQPGLRDRIEKFAQARRWPMNTAVDHLVSEALDARTRCSVPDTAEVTWTTGNVGRGAVHDPRLTADPYPHAIEKDH